MVVTSRRRNKEERHRTAKKKAKKQHSETIKMAVVWHDQSWAERWRVRVPLKQEMRKSQPFAGGIKSFNAVAIVLSYFGRRAAVCSTM